MTLFQWLKDAGGNDPAMTVRRSDDPGAPLVRKRFRFFGRVQGVGFRYEAKMTAQLLDLVGWVRNEDDGTVVVEAEGTRGRVGEFLRVTRSVPRFRVTEVQSEDLPVLGTEKSFRVLY